jgi:GTPase SAR1 family protein
LLPIDFLVAVGIIVVMVTKALDSALDAQELAGDQRALLDLIEKLQFAQLDNVKLPQIVVVGDQSAGKSSVLEAITGTPFPRDAGACTRFATEIRLRRSAQTGITVSIIPDKNRSFKEQERMREFAGRVDANTPFDVMMRTAIDIIAPKNIPGRFAARDILVVEKRGPDLPLLTLVDLPGLVRNANNDQSLDDIKTIEALSDRYMKSSRTIILAVVGGNSDYVQAPILTKARHFDPKGTRTIGVLTKPDLTESIGLEDKFLDLVKNKDKRNEFRLGWYVLLNPGPREQGQPWPSTQERRRAESDFFSRGKWRSLPESNCGAGALMRQLSVQLQAHIGRHIGVLRKQIQKALDDTDAELQSLGVGRDTPQEMRIDLVELFSASKELVIPALYGFYKNPPKKNFFRVTADPRGTPAQNLRARAAEENDRFALKVRAHGRKFNFSATAPQGAVDPSQHNSQKRDFVRQEVETLLRQIRGSEFPMDPKPRAVYMLFQQYSESWPKLAQEHKDNLGVVCNEFLSELIDYEWPKRMREPIRREFLEPQMKALMEKAQQELDLLTQDMNLEVQPYDPEYEERLRNWQMSASKEGAHFTEAEEVLEKMLIYYELSAKGFIRNVITQVVERHLLQGMYGLFNSVGVLGMNDDTIEAIAAENKETRDRRQTLKVQKKAIEEAKDICSSLAMRKELRMFAEEPEVPTDSDSDDEASSKSPSRPSRRVSRRPEPPQVPDMGVDNSGYTSTVRFSANEPMMKAERPPIPNNAVDDTHGTSRAPQQPPPPPPRPDKVRSDDRNYGEPQPYAVPQRSPSRQSQDYYYTNTHGSNNPYVPAEPRASASASLDPEYARRQASQRKVSSRA